MPVSTSAVKVNPVTGALIDPPVATFAAANGLLTSGSSDAKNSVRAATTTNGTLATAFENGDTIDGIVLATSDRILIKNQSAPAENGIYVVAASGAPTRATDFDAWTEIVGAFVTVESGTINAGTQWLCNVVAGGTLGVTAITFVVPKNFVDLTTAQNIGGLKTFTTGLNTTGATSEISTSGANAYIKTTGAYAAISTEGEYGGINTIGASASIQTSGLDATIFTTGANAHIFTYNAGAYIQTRSTFKLFGGTYTTTISHAATANRALALPDADGTLLSTAAIGVSVQAYDADLTTWAGITPGTGVATANLARPVFATVATAAGTTTLTVTSAITQEATGSTTQTYTLPVVTTLVAGWATTFINKSTGNVTLKSSGGNSIVVLAGGQSVTLVCKSISADTTAAAWDVVGLSPELFVTVRKSAGQIINENTETTVAFATVTGGTMQASWSANTFTAPATGLYEFEGVVNFYTAPSNSAPANTSLFYQINGGASQDLSFFSFYADISAQSSVPFKLTLSMTAGQTFILRATADCAGEAATWNLDTIAELTITRKS